jgi:glycosyltransferase involved in cell wall biosynthesis
VKVALFQPALPHYRLPVFSALSRRAGIDLKVYYGQVPGLGNSRAADFNAQETRQFRLRVFGEDLVFDPAWLAEAWSGGAQVLLLPWDLHHVFLVPALLLARLRGKGTVLWGHGYSKTPRPWRRILRDAVGHLADSLLFYNHAAAERLTAQGWDERRVFVAPNTQDQTEIQAARRHWLRRPRKMLAFRVKQGLSPRSTVLYCSRLEKSNRVDLLIRAHAQLAGNLPRTRLVIIGQGPDLGRLQALVADLEVQPSVLFLGGVYGQQELAPWFLSASVFCYPCNIGLSILHAFGYGLPVVTSDDLAAHNPEVEALRDQKNGLLYRDQDVFDLAEKLERFFDDSRFRRKLSLEARKTALAGYPLSKMVQGLKASLLAAGQACAAR